MRREWEGGGEREGREEGEGVSGNRNVFRGLFWFSSETKRK